MLVLLSYFRFIARTAFYVLWQIPNFQYYVQLYFNQFCCKSLVSLSPPSSFEWHPSWCIGWFRQCRCPPWIKLKFEIIIDYWRRLPTYHIIFDVIINPTFPEAIKLSEVNKRAVRSFGSITPISLMTPAGILISIFALNYLACCSQGSLITWFCEEVDCTKAG